MTDAFADPTDRFALSTEDELVSSLDQLLYKHYCGSLVYWISMGNTGNQRERGPLVSVVIPTYYRNETLCDAIESALGQTHEPVEVIVVDDSGTANARSVVADYDDVTYIPFEENRGAVEAREAGIDASSGAYIQLLDDDDYLLPEKFSRQLPLFSESVGVVYTGYRNATSGRTILPSTGPTPYMRGDILEDALRMVTSPCNVATMLIAREVFDRLLPFKHRHEAEDMGMKIELAQMTEFDFVDESHAVVRDTPDSRGVSSAHFEARRGVIDGYAELYREFPLQRRQALKDLYREKAESCLERNRWSAAAPLTFLKAGYYGSEQTKYFVAAAGASLLGRPGFELGRSVMAEVRTRRARG